MSTVEAIQVAKHFRQTGQLPTGAPDAGVIMLGLLQAIDDATELKDRLVLDGRANKEEADGLRAENGRLRDALTKLPVDAVTRAALEAIRDDSPHTPNVQTLFGRNLAKALTAK